MAQQPPVGQVLLLMEALRSHLDTPLVERSAWRRDLYLTTHNTHNRQTSMPLAGFEPTIPANPRPQTHALDLAVTGTGSLFTLCIEFHVESMQTQFHHSRSHHIKRLSRPAGTRAVNAGTLKLTLRTTAATCFPSSSQDIHSLNVCNSVHIRLPTVIGNLINFV